VIRVVLADDQRLVRAGFRALLERAEDIQVVGEAEDGASAAALARELRPDVVLMDIRMPGVDGLEAARRILNDDGCAGSRIIMLTTFGLDEYVFEALSLGASGFLLKDVEPGALREAVRVVAAGEALLSPSVTRSVIETFIRRKPVAESVDGMETLTERERDVVALVAEGLNNHEIAERLVVSPATAKTHVSRAMQKVGARDRAQLVVFAYRAGIAGS
jgi:DNA-binding NarL/FixJ family response regulator